MRKDVRTFKCSNCGWSVIYEIMAPNNKVMCPNCWCFVAPHNNQEDEMGTGGDVCSTFGNYDTTTLLAMRDLVQVRIKERTQDDVGKKGLQLMAKEIDDRLQGIVDRLLPHFIMKAMEDEKKAATKT